MSTSPDRKLGRHDGIRLAVTWLHGRAREMNDPHARAVLNSAAFNLGEELAKGELLERRNPKPFTMDLLRDFCRKRFASARTGKDKG